MLVRAGVAVFDGLEVKTAKGAIAKSGTVHAREKLLIRRSTVEAMAKWASHRSDYAYFGGFFLVG